MAVKKTRKNKAGSQLGTLSAGGALGVTTSGAGQAWIFQDRLDPFPARFKTNLTYSEDFALTAPVTTGVFGTETIFRLNSLYDPDFGGAGTYPYQFPSLQLLYGKYIVDQVLIDLEWYDPSIDGLVVGAWIQPSAMTTTLAGKTVPYASIVPGCAVRSIANSGEQMVRQRQVINLPKLEGLTANQWENNLAQVAALVTTNPLLTPWLRCAVASPGGSSGTIRIRVKLTFRATLYERIATSS